MQAEQKNAGRKSKAAVANARVGLVDKETGEVLDEGSLIYVPKRVRIKGFFMGMQEGFEGLATRRNFSLSGCCHTRQDRGQLRGLFVRIGLDDALGQVNCDFFANALLGIGLEQMRKIANVVIHAGLHCDGQRQSTLPGDC